MAGKSFCRSLRLTANKEIDSQSIDAVKPIGKYLLAIKLTHYMTVIGFTNAIHFVCSSQTVFSLPFRQIKNCCLVSFVVMVITGFLREVFGNFVKVAKTPSFFVLLQLYSVNCFVFEILFLFGDFQPFSTLFAHKLSHFSPNSHKLHTNQSYDKNEVSILNKVIPAVAPSHADGIKYIRKGSIVTRPKCDKAAYYRVADIFDECTEPIVAKQSKTLVLEYIGSGAKAIEHINQRIHFIPDLMPYAQMRYIE